MKIVGEEILMMTKMIKKVITIPKLKIVTVT
jgi:hypothetical protein